MIRDIEKEIKSIAKSILETEGFLEIKENIERIESLYKKSLIYHFLSEKNKKIEKSKKTEVSDDSLGDKITSAKIPEFIKKGNSDNKVFKSKKTINDLFSKDFNIGLNDRLVFIKNLFDSNEEDYQRVISQLSTFQNWEEAESFINKFIKPDYRYWKGKDAFEKRFLSFVKNNFQ